MQKEDQKVKGAAYTANVKIKKNNTKPFVIFSSLIAVVVILFGSFFTAPKLSTANAAFMGFLCNNKTLGNNMKPTLNLHLNSGAVPFSNSTGRTWTLEEAFGGTLSFVNYYGETAGEGAGFLLADTDDLNKRIIPTKSKGKEKKLANHAEVLKALEDNKDKLKAERTIPACTIDNLPLFIASFLFMIASAIMNLVSIFVTFAFDSGFICKETGDTNCVDLVGVIGGSGSQNGGIIGTLTSNIYIPLAVIAIAIAAFSILYQGIVKRQFRTAFGYLAWILLAFIFGLAALLNPNLLARAPMAISNSVAGCIIGAFNGMNCFSDSSTNPKLELDNNITSDNGSGASCASEAAQNKNPADILSMAINSMGCSIWKSFILQSHVAAEFGVSLESLDTDKEPAKTMIDQSGIPATTFCVHRYTSQSYSEAKKTSPIQFTDSGKPSSKICNLAVYQMYLQTKAESTGDSIGTGNTPDVRWYNLIAVLVQNDDVWSTWNPDFGSGLLRIITGFVAIISSVAGGIVLVTIAVYAMVYYLSAIILMALAPLFLLFALQPTKGKKIFLGWVEKIVSSILKYLASAFFLIVALAFYSAVFGNLTNPFITLIFIIILSVALFMYRKEIVDLIGRVNMGGEQLSNRFAGLGNSAKRFTAATVGASIGGAMRAGKGNRFAGAKAGASAGAMRDLSRRGGIVGAAAQHSVKMKPQAVKDLKEDMSDTRTEISDLEAQEQAQENIVNRLEAQSEQLSNTRDDVQRDIDLRTDKIKEDANDRVIGKIYNDYHAGKYNEFDKDGNLIATKEGDFAKYMVAQVEYESAKYAQDHYRAKGDTEKADQMAELAATRLEELELARGAISDEDFAKQSEEFNKQVEEAAKVGIRNDSQLQTDLRSHSLLTDSLNRTNAQIISAESTRIALGADKVVAQDKLKRLEKLGDHASHGGHITSSDIRKIHEKSAKRAEKLAQKHVVNESVNSNVLNETLAQGTYDRNYDVDTSVDNSWTKDKYQKRFPDTKPSPTGSGSSTTTPKPDTRKGPNQSSNENSNSGTSRSSRGPKPTTASKGNSTPPPGPSTSGNKAPRRNPLENILDPKPGEREKQPQPAERSRKNKTPNKPF